jgi:hypothetical protein
VRNRRIAVSRLTGLVLVYLPRWDGEAGVDSGPQDRQHGAVSPGPQELERLPDVLRGLRPAAS